MNAVFVKFFLCWILIMHTDIVTGQSQHTKRLHNRHFNFSITIPDRMTEVVDNAFAGERLYYDTSAGIILIISARESKFSSVDDYLNCTLDELEQQLKFYGDTTLQLVSCSQSPYYPEKTTALHFRVSSFPFDYNTYLIYFIHHRHRDIQISFTYKQANEQKSIEYINAVMQTLTLNAIL